MRSAEEIAEARIPFPRMCAQIYKDELRDIIRAAQIDAAEWMREEAAKVITDKCRDGMTRDEEAAAIRAIKLPGETICRD